MKGDEELNELLSENAERIDGDYTILSADNYDTLPSGEDHEPPVQEAQPGYIKVLLLQHSKISYDELLPKRRPTTKQAIKALGNDYKGIQVIPIAEYRVGWFHYTFARYKWREAYIEWREQGKCI